jgi:ceramide glucosyltransferase
MDLLLWLTVGCAAVAAGYQLFQLVAAWRFLRGRRRLDGPGPLPAVTVLKPLKGPGIDLYANLASFCRQVYPSYQIVFGVEDPNDPAVAVVQQIRRDFPARDIALSVGNAAGTNRKVANLRHMMRYARHDILVLSDSDIRVRPDYLRAIVAPLDDPAVGLSTCLYRAVGRFGLPSVIESLFINTDFIPMVLADQMVQRFRRAYGASIAFRREALERIGGFAALADHLADDNLLGLKIADAGYRLVLLPYVVETVLDSVTLGDVWRHQLRWSRTYRVCQPIGWFASVITHATLWGTLALVASGASPLGVAVFVTAVATRLTTLAGVLRLLRDEETRRYLWLVPAKDLAYSVIWAAAFLGRQVVWSGQALRIERDGRMVPLGPTPEPAVAEPAAAAILEALAAQRYAGAPRLRAGEAPNERVAG